MVAAWKIGATDRTLEQHIADEGEPRLRLEKHHVAGGMAGKVQHVEVGSFSHWSGVNAGVRGKPNISLCCGSDSSQKASSRCGPSIGIASLAASSAVAPT